jgi:GWxTD domain-containing protein
LTGLPEQWRIWLDQEVYPLISDEQRETFLALESEAQRVTFAERLWDLWGVQTGLGSDFQRVYSERLRYCRETFRSTTEDRARAVLIYGHPDSTQRSRCSRVFFPLEFWYWEHLEGLGNHIVVLFYQPDGVGPWRVWSPFETRRVLYRLSAWTQKLQARSRIDGPELQCFNSDTLMRLLDAAERWGPRAATLTAGLAQRYAIEAGPESSTRRFMEFSALLPNDAEQLKFSVSQIPHPTRGDKVDVGFTVTLESAGLGRSGIEGNDLVQLNLVGEISHGESMVDRFRYRFTVPDAPDQLTLLFDRSLRPGDYVLRVKLEDVHSRRAGVTEIELSVRPPVTENLAATPIPTVPP